MQFKKKKTPQLNSFYLIGHVYTKNNNSDGQNQY
jgi:hypothetical protein